MAGNLNRTVALLEKLFTDAGKIIRILCSQNFKFISFTFFPEENGIVILLVKVVNDKLVLLGSDEAINFLLQLAYRGASC